MKMQMAILDVLVNGEGAGGRTTFDVLRDLALHPDDEIKGISLFICRKTLVELEAAGMVSEFFRYHRPGQRKSVWYPTRAGLAQSSVYQAFRTGSPTDHMLDELVKWAEACTATYSVTALGREQIDGIPEGQERCAVCGRACIDGEPNENGVCFQCYRIMSLFSEIAGTVHYNGE